MKSTFMDYGVNIIAYCLMPNHYHFLIQQLTDMPISTWLHKLFVGYTQAINKQQKRSGTLFEGRSKHILIDNDDYLIYLMWYIHYNPVGAGLVSKHSDWPFSNYLDCVGKRNGTMVDKDLIRQRFGSMTEYEKFMESYQIDRLIEEKVGKYLFD